MKHYLVPQAEIHSRGGPEMFVGTRYCMPFMHTDQENIQYQPDVTFSAGPWAMENQKDLFSEESNQEILERPKTETTTLKKGIHINAMQSAYSFILRLIHLFDHTEKLKNIDLQKIALDELRAEMEYFRERANAEKLVIIIH